MKRAKDQRLKRQRLLPRRAAPVAADEAPALPGGGCSWQRTASSGPAFAPWRELFSRSPWLPDRGYSVTFPAHAPEVFQPSHLWAEERRRPGDRSRRGRDLSTRPLQDRRSAASAGVNGILITLQACPRLHPRLLIGRLLRSLARYAGLSFVPILGSIWAGLPQREMAREIFPFLLGG